MGFSLDFLLPTFIGKYKDNIINPLEEREKEIVDTYTFAWHVNGKRANNTFTSPLNVRNNFLFLFLTLNSSTRHQLTSSFEWDVEHRRFNFRSCMFHGLEFEPIRVAYDLELLIFAFYSYKE